MQVYAHLLGRNMEIFSPLEAAGSFYVSSGFPLRQVVLVQFESRLNTPKALANFSPGLEHSDNPGTRRKKKTLKPS